jgi:hypothetical protein
MWHGALAGPQQAVPDDVHKVTDRLEADRGPDPPSNRLILHRHLMGYDHDRSGREQILD